MKPIFYYNYKNHFSLVLITFHDAEYCFTYSIDLVPYTKEILISISILKTITFNIPKTATVEDLPGEITYVIIEDKASLT